MLLNYILIFIIIAIGIGPMLWEIHKKKFDFFNLKNPFIIYFILQLGISGLLTLISGNASPEIGLDPFLYSDAYFKALLLSAAGLFLFQMGYYTQKSRALKLPKLLRHKWHKPNLSFVVFIYFMIGALAFALFLKLNGGITLFFEEREAWRAGGLMGQGFLMFPSTFLLTFTSLIYFLENVSHPSKSKLKVIKSITLFLLALIPSFIMGFRSAFYLPVLQLMVIWNYAYKKIPAGKLILCLCLIIIAFTLYGISRIIPNIDKTVVIDTISANPELAYSVISRSKGTEIVASVINRLDQTGEYEYGWRSLLEAATIIIPGALWADKPQPSGMRFTTYFFATNLALYRGYELDSWGGVSPTAVGELYWHFGWVGVVVGLYMLGRITKIIYSTLQRNLSNPNVLVSYAIFFTSFAMFAEAFQGYINGLVMSGIVIFFTAIILGIKLFSNDAVSSRTNW